MSATDAFELWERGKLLGSVVRFEDPSDPSRAFFSVRNRDRQSLGMIDAQGRVWRDRPHQREADWLGTGTVLQGARMILDGGTSAQLIEIALDDHEPREAHGMQR